jgi:hypothetical protein
MNESFQESPGANAATIDHSQTRKLRVMEVEPVFNEMVRMLQIEKARRLCTGRRASVYSNLINQSETKRKILWLFRPNPWLLAVPKLRVLI